VTFGGTFAPSRAKPHLVRHSGIVHGDLDHLDDVDAIKARLAEDPHIVYVFISPSGTGLKVADDAAYKHAWQTVANAHRQTYGLTWDRSGKDISRLCYLSWDSSPYQNRDAITFPVPDPVPHPTPRPTPPRLTFDISRERRERYAYRALETAVAMIDASAPGNRHDTRLRASELLGGYVAGGCLTHDEAWGGLAMAVARNTDDLDRAMKTIADGLQHGQARPITLGALEAERRDWLAAHGSLSRGCPSTAGTTNGGDFWGERWQRRQRAYEQRLRLPAREVSHG
jgi:VirE N-terminal domain